MFRMRERIRPINARRDPSNKQRNEEQERNPSIEERVRFLLTQRHSSRHRRQAENRRSRSRPWSLRALRFPNFDIHGVSIIAIIGMALGDFADLAVREGGLPVGVGDCDFGLCADDVREGIFVERVEETEDVEGGALAPDVAAGHDVDCDCD